MLNQELKEKLETMQTHGLRSIQKYYKENPKIKEKCQDISDYIEEILQKRGERLINIFDK